MKWMLIVVLLFAVFAILVPSDVLNGQPTDVNMGQVIRVLISGDTTGADSATVDEVLSIKSSLTGFLIVAIPCFLGGLTVIAVVGKGE